MTQKLVGYRIPIELRDELRKRAKELNMTMTGYVRYLLLITKTKHQ